VLIADLNAESGEAVAEDIGAAFVEPQDIGMACLKT
jgi:hypothetical protein